VLKTESGTFTTAGSSQGIEEISSSLQGGDRGRLILHDGQIFILRGDKVYNAQGALVK
jgi:hemin uptake protein HemP